MHIQIETINTATGGSVDAIIAISKVQRLMVTANHLADRLRLWSISDGTMLCAEDQAALTEWDALAAERDIRSHEENSLRAELSDGTPKTDKLPQ